MLRACKCQKWKSRFCTCLALTFIFSKITTLWVCEILGNFMKNWYFVKKPLNLSSNLKMLLHICDTYNWCDYQLHTTFHFYFIDFLVKTDSFPNFAFITVKSPSVTQRLVSQENAFTKGKNLLLFFSQTYRLK